MVKILDTYALGVEADAKYDQMRKTNRSRKAVDISSRIIGLPFQYLDTTDIRPFDDVDVGRNFIENMIAEAPMLTITPGVSNFFSEFSESEKNSLSEYIDKAMGENRQSQSTLTDVTELDGRYYSLTPTYTWYMSYVNLMCRVCAIYLGIADDYVPGTTTTYAKFNWANYENIHKNKASKTGSSTEKGIFDAVKDGYQKLINSISDKLIGDYNYLKLYVDGAESISSSFSNSTTTSKVAGLFDSVESLWKELNVVGAADIANKGGDILGGALSGVGGAFGNDNLDKLIGLTEQVIQGSNILFPEIWSDSSTRNSYSFKIELVSPYGDPESVFINILMPLMHIFGLGIPRQVSANSFTTPFLVQAYLKGGFAVELGIVSSISIDKGGSGTWNVHNLPNKVTVNLEISDLYNTMMMSSSVQPLKFMQNDGLITFLASSCGVDLMEPNLDLKLKTIYSSITNTPIDIARRVVHGNIIEGVREKIMNNFRI